MRALDATTTRATIVEAVCARIIAGESIAAVFRTPDANFPSYATFWRWLAADEELSKLVYDAQLAACEALADRLLDVARETRIGEIVTEGPKGIERKHVDMVERSRLECDAIKWSLAKRLPSRFGDRTILTGDADNPIAIDDAKAVLARRLAPKLVGGGSSGSDSGAQ